MNDKRDSNIELLRLICYFGILLLHAYGNFMANATGNARLCGILINCLCNTGVSIFVLISGYYGIRVSSYKKILSFWLCILFYSLLNEIVVQCVNSTFELRSFITSFFPIYTRRWWYISTYYLLMIFSPWLNKIVDALSEKEFLKLLVVFFMIFSVIPSSIGWTFFHDDGKGIGNLLFVYLVGQYLSKYLNKYKVTKKGCMVIGIVTLGIMVALTTVKTVLKREIGIESPFFRDASVLTVILSLCIFLFFLQCKISSKTLNSIAKKGIGIYLIDWTVAIVLLKKISVPLSIVGIGYCMCIALLTMLVGITIEAFRCNFLQFLDKYIIALVDNLVKKLTKLANNIKKMFE